MSTAGRFALAVLGAALAEAALGLLRAAPPGGAELWMRSNHRGRRVSLLAGPAAATAATITACAGGEPALSAAAAVAGAGSGLVGVYDDLAGARPGQQSDKGFAGHLRALRERRISTGLVKVAVVGLSGLAAGRSAGRGPLDRVVTGGVVAGTANLVNLLDLRPGRALKVMLLLGTSWLAGHHGGLIAGPVGAAAAVLRRDLAEEVMLGDGGANALGALLGLRVALAGGPGWRQGVLAVLVGLTAASERVSFTRVIETTPGLRQFDSLGRRPATR
ncbi:MAG: hypothetical protein ACR2JK_09425 [Geodermatophilaceae bacterium]